VQSTVRGTIKFLQAIPLPIGADLIRVTIELIPYGAEAMAKTIAELCILETAENLEAAGYRIRNETKIEEIAKKIKKDTKHGVLELVKEILESENKQIEEVELFETLIQQTRLYHQTLEEKTDE
jgi:hypothetical protein